MPSRGSKVYPKMINRRERAMLNLIAQGYKNEEIAGELYISEKTVMESQMNLMRKLNVPNVTSVIDQALEKGLISVYEVLESRFSRRRPEPN
ncbi:MAG: LuxR C-terminal-related transcriptional regulator [Thermodesulfobacteriota bacterium]